MSVRCGPSSTEILELTDSARAEILLVKKLTTGILLFPWGCLRFTLSFYVRWNIDARRIFVFVLHQYSGVETSAEPPMLTQRPGRPALSATEIDTVSTAHPVSGKHFINVTGKDDIILGD